MVPRHPGLHQQRLPCGNQILGAHLRQALHRGLFDPHLHREEIAPQHRQCIELVRGKLDAFVFHQAAHQFGTRILLVLAQGARARQQHSRFYFHQQRRHQQIFRGKLEVTPAHQLDVLQILLGEPRHGDIEDVDIGLADQVEQQVERAFESVEEDLQRIRRDVQIQRHFEHCFATDCCHTRV